MKNKLPFLLLALSFSLLSGQNLDENFGNDGILNLNPQTTGNIIDYKVTFDSKIYLLTFNSSSGNVLKINQDGSFDTGFGTNGVFEYTTDNDVSPVRISVRGDGSFLVLSNEFLSTSFGTRLEDFLANTGRNPNFGTGGIYVKADPENEDDYRGKDLHILPNGSIYIPTIVNLFGFNQPDNAIVHTVSQFGNNPSSFLIDGNSGSSVYSSLKDNTMYLTYYNPGTNNKAIIRSFDTNNNTSQLLVSQSIAAGNRTFKQILTYNNDIFVLNEEDPLTNDFHVIRKYDENGVLDESFGINKRIAFFGEAIFSIDTSGNIFVLKIDSNDLKTIAIKKYTPNGILDSDFGTNGTFSITLDNEIETTYLEPNHIQIDMDNLYFSGYFLGNNASSFLIKVNLKDNVLSNEEFNLSPSDFSIYPNPASNQISIVNNGIIPVKNLNIFDSEGRKLTSFEMNGTDKSMNVDLSSFSSGVYFIQLGLKEKNVFKKLIKQ